MSLVFYLYVHINGILFYFIYIKNIIFVIYNYLITKKNNALKFYKLLLKRMILII